MIESSSEESKIESMIESFKRVHDRVHDQEDRVHDRVHDRFPQERKGIELNPNHSLKQSPMRLKPHERESRNRIEFEIVPETKVHEPQAKAP